jgi:hypothetical protein
MTTVENTGLGSTYLCDIRTMRYFRIPTRCKRDLRSFGTLRNVEWQFRTDVSGHPICPIFKGQAVKDCLID